MITKFQVAYKNLLRKKMRTILTVIGIALSSWVLVSLLGFNQGYEASLNKDIDNMGFQIMVMAKGCPYEAATLMLKGGTGLRYMKESIMSDIEKEPEVEQLTPILMSAVFDPNKPEDLDTRGSDHGLDATRYFMMARPAPTGALKKDDGRAKLDPASRAEWESVRKMQDGIARDAGAKGAILGGFNE